MHRPRLYTPFALALLAVTALCPMARAFVPAPELPYKKPTADGKYVFVMRAGLGSFKTDPDDQEKRTGVIGYPKSGMYRNDGSKVPLWTVDWYAYESRVEVAPDGVHMAWHDDLTRYPEGDAVRFFANGVLIRSYSVGELVDHPSRCKRISGDSGMIYWQHRVWFDPVALQLMVETQDGNWYLFDARTGGIVDQHRPARVWFRSLALLIAGVLLLKGIVGLSFGERLSAWWAKRYAAGRIPRILLLSPVVLAGLLGVVWYATLVHYQPWGWILTAFLTIVCVLGLFNLSPWTRPGEQTAKLPERRRVRIAADVLAVALGLAFLALAFLVY